jgi:hypothetical protein
MSEREENHYDATEELLREWGRTNESDRIPSPDVLDAAIARGIRQGSRRKRRRLGTRAASIAACTLLLAGVLSVRFSPAVAAYVGQVPLLRPLVELIHHDKGLELALENDFFQAVGVSETKDGVTVTVDGIVADESRILVFLTVDNAPEHYGHLRTIRAWRPDHQSIKASISTDLPLKEKDGRRRGTIDISFQSGEALPELLELELDFFLTGQDETAASPAWTFTVPVDKDRFAGMKQEYEINRRVIVEGQEVTFSSLTVYPTRMDLEVAYNPANTMKIFNLENIRIEDENGEIFMNGANGLLSSRQDDNHLTLSFQSNYFLKPMHMTLKVDSIRAMEKSRTEVRVDLEEKRLLGEPSSRLTLADIGATPEGYTVLDFRFHRDQEEEEKRAAFSIFSWAFKDASGKEFQTDQMAHTGEGFQYYLPPGSYVSPVILTLEDYPSSYKADIAIPIK